MFSRTVVPPRGPFPAQIAVVGEAPGKNETAYREPFIGAPGQELNSMLIEAGIHPASVYFTNVFKVQPEGNNVELFFGPKSSSAPLLPPLRAGKYLPVDATYWLDLLRRELAHVQPRVILALGNTALWALTGKTGISKLRGVLFPTELGAVLATYHPAAILRTWALRSVAVADLNKARQYLFGEVDKPDEENYELFLNPSVADLHKFRILVNSHPDLSIDIETSRGQITMIGFAVTPKCGFCIPFFDPETLESYWQTPEEETEAWLFCQWALRQPKAKCGQNFMYDAQYIVNSPARTPKLFVPRFDDSMLSHHAYQPEMKKDLGGLVASYLNVTAWKELRRRRADEQVKKDE